MPEAFICDAIRTPIGRYGGALAGVRTDDLGALPMKALIARNPGVDWSALDDVILRLREPGRRGQPQRRAHGAAAGRPAAGSAGRDGQPALRLGPRRGRHRRARDQGRRDRADDRRRRRKHDARALRDGQGRHAPSRAATRSHDTTIGWRFVNPLMKAQYGVDSMPETAENVAAEFGIARADQDAFALRSQQRARRRRSAGRLRRGDRARRRCPRRRATPSSSSRTSIRARPRLEALAKLKGIVRPDGTVTAGNASGVNDGAGACSSRRADAATQLRPDAARARRRARPSPASRRASWASARRRPRASCWRRPALDDRRHRRDRAERGLRRAGAGRRCASSACPTTRRT